MFAATLSTVIQTVRLFAKHLTCSNINNVLLVFSAKILLDYSF